MYITVYCNHKYCMHTLVYMYLIRNLKGHNIRKDRIYNANHYYSWSQFYSTNGWSIIIQKQ